MGLNIERSAQGVVTLTMAFPPVNAISTTLRAALLNALLDAEHDDKVTAVVITGNDGFFSAGADLVEFNAGRSFDYPSFHASVLPFIHGMSKPVVAAISGNAIGGGLELALWCHARVAAQDVRVGLPETTLGLMPGAGGTQLLPRALGLEVATGMIVSGAMKTASALAGTPLFDDVVPLEQVLGRATQLAVTLAERGRPYPHLAQNQVLHSEPQGFLQFARGQAKARRDFVPSMLTAIDAIAISLKLSALEGLAREFEMFRPLVSTMESRAIRHAFFAERISNKVDDMPADVKPQSVKKAGVIGAGYMGSGIAHCLARAGLDVFVYDVQAGAAHKSVEQLLQVPELAKANLTAVDSLTALQEADIVIEAVVENLEVKQELFRALDAVVRQGAILASNTSTLDLDLIAEVTKRPQAVIGMHFFGPAPVMKLLEIVRGKLTSNEVLASTLELAKRLRKVPVVSRVGPGFIANRIYSRLMEQAMSLAAQGIQPEKVDAALERWGWKMGPFKTMDLIGNDVLVKARLPGAALGAGERLQDQLVAQGRLGQKAGKGWYAYGPQAKQGMPDSDVHSMLPRPTLPLNAQQITDRCMLAMINEAAAVLEEGIAQRASDIDLSFLLGYGFPRLKGGPLFYAQEMGLSVIVQKLDQLHRQFGDAYWKPAASLVSLARSTGQFPAA